MNPRAPNDWCARYVASTAARVAESRAVAAATSASSTLELSAANAARRVRAREAHVSDRDVGQRMGERLELADRSAELHAVLEPLARDRHQVAGRTDEIGGHGDVTDHQRPSPPRIVDRREALQLKPSPRLAGERLHGFHVTRRPGHPRLIGGKLDEHVGDRGPRQQRR